MKISLTGFAVLWWMVLLFLSTPLLSFATDRPNHARAVPATHIADTSFNLSDSPTVEEIFRVHVFKDPLVPMGQPTAADNAALSAALHGYANRSSPDDFSSLTVFLDAYPDSPWAAAVWTGLGSEYYNTAHYSLAIEAFKKGWGLGQHAKTANQVATADRALAELAYMYARLGRMAELDSLFASVKGWTFSGPAVEKVSEVRDGLWLMKHRPEVAFRCGPLALYRIKQAVDPKHPCTMDIFKSASTTNGTSLPQLVALSQTIGLNYQMAFREKGSAFIVPSVIHWKVGHYAAIVRQVGGQYLVKDLTFRNDVWASAEALDSEASGYFLVPSGTLPPGWRSVDAAEGGTVWGKGSTSGNDPSAITKRDPSEGPVPCQEGMTTSRVHLMDVNLSLVDTPVGYTPPVGPPVPVTVRYNSGDSFQPFIFNYANLGALWTCDWISYITDTPSNALADVTCYMGGGGYRTYTDFNATNETFGYEQFDQTLLTRTSSNPISYQLLFPDGSQEIFNQSDGSIGTSRNIFLTEVIDPQGNATTLTYNTNLLITAITDAIGQTTTFNYGLVETNYLTNDVAADPYKLTGVTDPFGRTARFNYVPVEVESEITGNQQGMPEISIFYAWDLGSITDEIGMTSQYTYGLLLAIYETSTLALFDNLVTNLITPYGTNTFLQGGEGTTRYMETSYPDGSRDRVEYNQTVNVPTFDPPSTVPTGMDTYDGLLEYRDTFYWTRNASALAYGDYSKARVFHWLHTADGSTTSGIIESIKNPLENRVWYDYANQPGSPIVVGSSNRPLHVGRVLDDGTTQLYTFGYNGFGHVTNSIDPVGRTFTYIYATNGIDLMEVHQTRAPNNDLLFKATYNSQHRPLTEIDAAGETNTFTYNARGQILTATDPKGETATYAYDNNGYLLSVTGPLGTNDSATYTYDSYGRVRTTTDVSGYTLTFDYDNLDRITRITYPDSTYEQVIYNLLDPVLFQDRAGRQTSYVYDSMRQLVKKTDPLGRVTQYDWCGCGALKSITDPMNRTTVWDRDVEGRLTDKIYGDGSKIFYTYENTTSRLREMTDERLQNTSFIYNPDDTIASCGYNNTIVPTPDVNFAYDPNYRRVTSRTDGAGTSYFSYYPITNTPSPGAGELESVVGPVTNALVTYSYDELGRPVHHFFNGVDSATFYDAAGRAVVASNALGDFTLTYDGTSDRLTSKSLPNGVTAAFTYGNNIQDFLLQEIANTNAAGPVSEFAYTYDEAANRITTWSQQLGAQAPSISWFGYDAVNELLSVAVTNSGAHVNNYAYSYDFDGNRLSEQIGSSTYNSSYNALNQLDISTAPGSSRTNEWDGAHRLAAVNSGNQRTEFCYDAQDHLTGIRQLVNGAEVSHRLFAWDGNRICEELDTNGVVTKRFFPQGFQLATGANAGLYYYTRDHLSSIRELIDSGGNVRAEYTYDPFGLRTKVSGDLDTDFGYAGMFWSSEANLSITHFRDYDPVLGRWLSRDPLKDAEMMQGPNLYAYVGDGPVNAIDPEGLAGTIPGWGFNTVTVTIIAAAASGEGEELAEDLGMAAPRLAQAAQSVGACLQNFGQTILGNPDTINEYGQTGLKLAQQVSQIEASIAEVPAVVPQIEAQAAQAEDEVLLYGQDFEDWLAEQGQIGAGGTGPLGPDAISAMQDFASVEQQFYEELRDLVPVGDAMQLAWKQAVDYFGFDPYLWLR